MMEYLLNRSALLRQAVVSVVDYPLADDSPRVQTSHDAALLSLEHAEALRLLMAAELAPFAAALLRCQFEAFVRGVWTLSCASDSQIALLSSAPDAEARERRELPMLSQMLQALAEKPHLVNMVPLLMEMKQHAWAALNSFVHAGAHALDRSRTGFPLPLAINVVRISNNLMMMAGQNMAILTGQQGLQGAVITFCDAYADCLLLDEERRRAMEAAASTAHSG